jgi:hypothetical protein
MTHLIETLCRWWYNEPRQYTAPSTHKNPIGFIWDETP